MLTQIQKNHRNLIQSPHFTEWGKEFKEVKRPSQNHTNKWWTRPRTLPVSVESLSWFPQKPFHLKCHYTLKLLTFQFIFKYLTSSTVISFYGTAQSSKELQPIQLISRGNFFFFFLMKLGENEKWKVKHKGESETNKLDQGLELYRRWKTTINNYKIRIIFEGNTIRNKINKKNLAVFLKDFIKRW